ncbi:Glycosyltransferase, catalytic subunit of cellulose synthase and poly-beta-1,6-N-acetylglucosamine synthase [Flexibacter flexilis DSM 6793]|uniref:Glycosyltransferase, catalytic subunit of cellulose synthase and poly-beta-1,6-N-acetylglucosamine synthase n=1 Tax=Flexibacter flexilis DSM 6793 TaxID=927664 RepID=A0A1I1N742_9BACT|nr:glycosyltransferase [Flexibacter flexilis]SFC89560.1 Glycosyltransferase, catalytic subunit of cellulose synthase and poly-beta-1,6-N-acetylglucosamine synthase [Flexibacter flexilis DSM 6793]
MGFSLFACAVLLAYCVALWWLRKHWNAALHESTRILQMPAPSFFSENKPFISVIIAVRNEAANLPKLLQSLDSQMLKPSLFEVIFIDDDSDDHTASILQSHAARYALRYFLLEKTKDTAHKKRAVGTGISHARGQLIVCTDGDCHFGANWLAQYYTFQQQTQAVFVSAPVCLEATPPNLFTQMQVIEFASLIGTGGASLHAGAANMCNGANLAYLKSAYEQVGGFAGKTHLASGDDEFLMHKMAAAFPKKVIFLAHPDSVVNTATQPNWRSFVAQRKRWASKWSSYQDWKVTGLAIGTAAFHGLVIACWICVFISPKENFLLLISLIIKAITEYVLLKKICTDTRAHWSNAAFGALQILYSPYVVFFGLSAALLPKGYTWKSRQVQ